MFLEGSQDYAIFFEDQQVDKYVTSFSTDIAVNGAIGSASIRMLYTDSFMNIEYLTMVRVFIKNMFSDRYQMVFQGQIRARSVSMAEGTSTITFTAKDMMAWLPKMPVPMLFGLDKVLDQITSFTWLAKGVDYDTVAPILTTAGASMMGMNLREIITELFTKIEQATVMKSDQKSNNIYNQLSLKGIIRVCSDIDKTLRDKQIMNLFFQGAIIENMYVFLNNLIQQLGYEFYQDIDGIIKIKEPFWHEGIWKNHVIHPLMIKSFDESVNWEAYCTRVITVGGVDESVFGSATMQQLSAITPAGVFVPNKSGSGNFVANRNMYSDVSVSGTNSKFVQTPTTNADSASGAVVAEIAKSLRGKPYRFGGTGPDYFDGAGLVYYSYYTAGYGITKTSLQNYYKSANPISAGDLQPGDLGFIVDGTKGPTDVYLYAGEVNIQGKKKHQWVYVNAKNGVVTFNNDSKTGKPGMKYGRISTTISAGYSGYDLPIPAQTPEVSSKLKNMKMTDLEAKIGISPLELYQPLIKRNIGGTTDDYVYGELQKFSEYMYHVNNASACLAGMTLEAAPWIRPGMNVWVDPEGLNRVYYVTAVRHMGGPGGVATSLGMTYGRSQEEYKDNFNNKGGKG